MPNDLIRYEARQVARRERSRAARLSQAQRPAEVAAAKIEAAAFATHVALQHAGMLSAAEGRLLAYAPLGEGRYKAIVDSFAGYACHELALLATKEG